MKKAQMFIAPLAGIAVGLSAVAAFGVSFGILVGLGLAAITSASVGLMLSPDAGIESIG